MTPAAPTRRGKRVRQESQAYMIPPHVNGIMKDTVDATKMTEPSQSNLRILAKRSPTVSLSLRKKKMAMVPVPIIFLS